ncbi:MAG TPA: pyroglutamyl-peptidase I [Candidatus Eremiobacteraeota bacterium]|nr:MAG: Pyrrolidone-carboxylate peptidase [bacterium ADurb.Bin363]HPZ08048.1 pyroglutamyl-peptidase I [Candidatus Eremiobacteraeota bacterium]
MRKIILSGFDPFDKVKINPSMEVVKLLKEDDIEGIKLYPLILPTIYGESAEILVTKMQELKPDVVISLGVATGRKRVTLERFAINIDDARTKDNKKNQRRGTKISTSGPEAYLSLLPLKDILNALHRYKIKADISNFCGTFVCNHLMYSVIHYIVTNNLPIKYGFVHLPKLSRRKEDTEKAMGLEKMVRAVKIIINNL